MSNLDWRDRVSLVVQRFIDKDLFSKYGTTLSNFFATGLENLELGPNRANSWDDLKNSLDDELLAAVRVVHGCTEV
jgi:hypothetical protein